jgi:hypothetical protein
LPGAIELSGDEIGDATQRQPFVVPIHPVVGRLQLSYPEIS